MKNSAMVMSYIGYHERLHIFMTWFAMYSEMGETLANLDIFRWQIRFY